MKTIVEHGVRRDMTEEEETAWENQPVTVISPSEARTKKHTEIDAMRDTMIARGFLYDFPDKPGTIQLRHDKDMTSVTGVASGGMANILLGDTDAQNFYKDKENQLHIMTNEQAVEMGRALKSWIEGHYQSAWAHKAALGETADDIEGYDISARWPE